MPSAPILPCLIYLLPATQDPLKVRISIFWMCTFGANDDGRGRHVKTALLAHVQGALAGVRELSFTIERRGRGAGVGAAGGAGEAIEGQGADIDGVPQVAAGGSWQADAGDGGGSWNSRMVAGAGPAISALAAARAGKGAGGGGLGALPAAALGRVGASWLGADLARGPGSSSGASSGGGQQPLMAPLPAPPSGR